MSSFFQISLHQTFIIRIAFLQFFLRLTCFLFHRLMKFRKVNLQIERRRKTSKSAFLVSEHLLPRSRLPSLRMSQSKDPKSHSSFKHLTFKAHSPSLLLPQPPTYTPHSLTPSNLSCLQQPSPKSPSLANLRQLQRGIYRNAKLKLGKTRLQTPPLLAQYNHQRKLSFKHKKNKVENKIAKKNDLLEVDLLMEERGVVNLVRRIGEAYGLLREYGYSDGQIQKLVYYYCRGNRDMQRIFFHHSEEMADSANTANQKAPTLRWERYALLELIREAVVQKSYEWVQELVYRVGELASNLEQSVLKRTNAKIFQISNSIKERQKVVNDMRDEVDNRQKDCLTNTRGPKPLKVWLNDFKYQVKQIEKKYGACDKITEINRKVFDILNNFSKRKTISYMHEELLNSIKIRI